MDSNKYLPNWVKTPEYRAYCNMLVRAGIYNNKSDFWHYYENRGITVSPEWLGPNGFEKFLEHVGRKPSPELVLDRKDNDGNYEPGNVRWVTSKVNNSNSVKAHMITFDGRTMNLVDWALEYGVKPACLTYRLKVGWSIEDALTTLPHRLRKGL